MTALSAIKTAVTGPRRIDYELIFRGEAPDNLSASVLVAYSAYTPGDDPDEDEQREEVERWYPIVGIGNIPQQYDGAWRARGYVEVSYEIEELLSYTSATSATTRIVRIEHSEGTEEREVSDTVGGENSFGSGRRGVDEPRLAHVAGSAYVFDGPVYENMSIRQYDDEAEEFVGESIVRNTLTMAQPCRVIEEHVSIPGYSYTLDLVFPSWLRSEANESIRSAISSGGYTTPGDSEMEVFSSYPMGLATNQSFQLMGLSDRDFYNTTAFFLESYDEARDFSVEPFEGDITRIVEDTDEGGEDLPYFYVRAN